MFLSFLTRERDRDFVNVSDRDLAQYDRFRPFAVPDRSPSLTVPDRSPFLTVPERFLSFMRVYDRFMSVFDRFMTF